MFERLKQRVGDMGVIRSLCLRAEEYARRDGEREPGAEHFLLAALDLPDRSARRAFERVGADPAALGTAISAQYASALNTFGLDLDTGRDLEAGMAPDAAESARGVYRAAASGREIVQALADRRRRGDRAPLVGAHVVIDVASMSFGVAARSLCQMGIDRNALARAATIETGAAETGRPI